MCKVFDAGVAWGRGLLEPVVHREDFGAAMMPGIEDEGVWRVRGCEELGGADEVWVEDDDGVVLVEVIAIDEDSHGEPAAGGGGL